MNTHTISSDEEGMALALEWAAKGMFITTPNPRVGCVIVKDHQVVAAGHTQPAGQAHAEIDALRAAALTGVDVRGTTMYVTLEPCSHFGHTPPCVDAIIQAGIGRVVAAIKDPNPLVAGQGLARLQAHGIATSCGVMPEAARELNIGFFSRMQRGTPWVRMKIAASLDGGTALHNGQSQWITSPQARADGHWWRARACAVLTGIGTVLRDDPSLTVRDVQTPRQPLRVIVDSRLQIPLDAKVLQGGGALIVAAQANLEKEKSLLAQGCEVAYLPDIHGKVDLPALMHMMGQRGTNELHIEAGARLNGSLIAQQCVDEMLAYLAPKLLGNAHGMAALGEFSNLADVPQLVFHEFAQVGPDLRVLARF